MKTEFWKQAITEANRRFANMTRTQRCAAIAKDAIWQVQNKSILPKSGCYLKPNTRTFTYTPKPDDPKCRGCAMACLFVGLADHQRIPFVGSGYMEDRDIIEEMEAAGAFTRDELRNIECAFEGYHSDGFNGLEYRNRHNETGEEPQSPSEYAAFHKKLFLAIAANIVHNSGIFNPANDPDAQTAQRIVDEAATLNSVKSKP